MPNPPKGRAVEIVFPDTSEKESWLIWVGFKVSIATSIDFRYSKTSLEMYSPQTLCLGKSFFQKRLRYILASISEALLLIQLNHRLIVGHPNFS